MKHSHSNTLKRARTNPAFVGKTEVNPDSKRDQDIRSGKSKGRPRSKYDKKGWGSRS